MFYSDIHFVREKMNQAGKVHQAFLFGINYEMTEAFFIENPMEQNKILFKVGKYTNKIDEIINEEEIQFEYQAISPEEYSEKFNIIHNGLKRGDSFLTNLTIKTPIKTNLSLENILMRSFSPYQILLPNRLVCFSPERFVKISKGIISTNPMKGTIDARIPNAEKIILADFKETAEHNTVVDLLRNDLSLNARNVKVNKFRYIDKIITNSKDILQVSSEIDGILDNDYNEHIGDILFSMLPAGSVCGAPKHATNNLIQQAEGETRGYYTGIFGHYDGNDLDSAVLIRYIEKDGEQLFYRSGGGITAYSNCEEEYNEALNKIYLPFA